MFRRWPFLPLFCREQFADTSFESKLDAVVALSCLLQGPTEVGNSVLAKAGVVDMLLALAESKEIDHQVCGIVSFSWCDRSLYIMYMTTPINMCKNEHVVNNGRVQQYECA